MQICLMADGVWGGISAEAPCIPPTALSRLVWQGARKVAQWDAQPMGLGQLQGGGRVALSQEAQGM